MTIFGLGTAQFSEEYGGADPAVLDKAAELGVPLVDTAPTYGAAEFILGRLLESETAEHWHPEVVSKILPGDLAGWPGRDYASIVLSHDPMGVRFAEWCMMLDLAARVSQLTGFSARIEDDPAEFKRRVSLYMPEVVQVPYSIVDQRYHAMIHAFDRWGIEVHTRSVFARGEALKRGYSMRACMDVAKSVPSHACIIGCRTPEQLEECWRVWHEE